MHLELGSVAQIRTDTLYIHCGIDMYRTKTLSLSSPMVIWKEILSDHTNGRRKQCMNNGSYDAHPFTNDLLRTLEDRDKSGGPLMLTDEVPLELGARTNGILQRPITDSDTCYIPFINTFKFALMSVTVFT